MRLASLALAAFLLVPAATAQVSSAPAATARQAGPPPVAARALVADTLYNQLDGGGSLSGLFLSENFEAANDEADSYLADDFVVPDGASWTVGTVTVIGFYSVADGGTFTQNETFNLIIWADDGGDPGAEVFRADAITPTRNDGGDLTLGLIDFALDDAVGGPVTLEPGAYWLTVQANLDFTANGTRYLWYTTNLDRAGLGELAHLFNYGGGFTSIGDCNIGWGEAVTAECGRSDDGDNGNLTFAFIAPDDGDPSTIADARDAGAGAEVFVEGTVTRAEGNYTYLQDETGGLAIRQTSGDFFDRVASHAISRGSVVRVTGTLSEFNGLLQISGGALASFEVVGSAEVPAPQIVTLAEIGSNGEAYEGELVRVEGVAFDALAPGGTFEPSTDYAATDGSGAGTVRVPPEGDTELEGTDLTASPSTVTGVVVQNSSTDPAAGYKVAVIALGDVANAAVALGASPDGRLALSAPTPNPSASAATVTVSMATAGPATLAVFDVLGREVSRVVDGPLAAGDTPVRIGLGGLPAGTYLVRLSADGVAAVRPLTVVR